MKAYLYYMKCICIYIFFFLVVSFHPIAVLQAQTNKDYPNILLVISDDLGVDASNGYHQNNLMPTTPTLDSLRSVGITFENVFSTPKCAPSRAAIMSGKYGIKTGVTGVPGNLDTVHTSIFRALGSKTNQMYADAVIGKWHISSPVDLLHPTYHGVDYYMGAFTSGVSDYFMWDKTYNGATSVDSGYATTVFTDSSINWVNDRNQPWFLWLAHVAPHSPFHEPPSHLYSIASTGNNFRKYLAMIEAMDFELNRLLTAMPDSVRENTLVIYVGDNGTPGSLLRDYPTGHGKSTLYQGGIRVPMIVAGAGVTRQGEREPALIHLADIYATILEAAGADLPGGIYNSLSFHHLLSNAPGATRDYNYSEIEREAVNGWTIRGPRYKLIQFTDSTQEMYDLIADSLEFNNLLDSSLTSEQNQIKTELENEANQIRTSWSCHDHIQNGDEEGIDCGGSQCAPCTSTAIEDLVLEDGVLVFPNPVAGQVIVKTESELIMEIQVYNAFGELIYSQGSINSKSKRIELNHLSPQVLFVKVKLGMGTRIIKLLKL